MRFDYKDQNRHLRVSLEIGPIAVILQSIPQIRQLFGDIFLYCLQLWGGM